MVQHVLKAFPFDSAPDHLVRDRDSIYEGSFVQRVNGLGIQEKVIAPRSPWQNPIAALSTAEEGRKSLP